MTVHSYGRRRSPAFDSPGLRALVTDLRSGAMTAEGAASACLERARGTAELNAFIAIADVVDPPRSAGTPLAGLPVAVKDNIDVVGFACTAGTPALADWRPPRDAAIVATLRSAGAVVIGKANLHELAIGITSNNPTFGPARNPHDLDLIAGGSSGGSAAAVAAGVVPLALGTDTAGSVRIPAALCGCVGYRPTSGRYPQDGVVPLSRTRDTVGLLTRDVADAMLVDQLLTQTTGSAVQLAGQRLGVPRPYFYDGLDPELRVVIDAALDRLADAGAVLIETEVPELDALLAPVSLPLTLFEAVRDLARYLDAHRCPIHTWEIVDAMAGPVERAWYENELWGDPVSDDTYRDIIASGRPAVIDAYRQCFERDRLDALVMPTTRLPARPVGQDDVVLIDGEPVPTLGAYLRNTDPASVAGLPSISVPAGLTESGLPVGLMFEAPAGHDARLLALADAFDRLRGA
jgi:Asp-tRNA(Asn)/Glu-tRNA(Gln) amidotransferase A subunit family amidase